MVDLVMDRTFTGKKVSELVVLNRASHDHIYTLPPKQEAHELE
jgi:hypothetical protein